VLTVLVIGWVWLYHDVSGLPMAPKGLARLASATSAVSLEIPLPQESLPSTKSIGADKGIVEICGLGMQDVKTDPKELEDRYQREIDQAVEVLIAQMLLSPDTRTQLAGLRLKLVPVTVALWAQSPNGAAASKEQFTKQASPWVDRLTSLAASSKDAALYAQAAQFCFDRTEFPACARVSMAQWARLDPHNMSPWRWLLASASMRKDQLGVQEALHQMSQATSSTNYFGFLLTELALASTAQHTDIRNAAAVALASWIFVVNLSGDGSIIDACSKVASADANRRQVCDRIAHRMVDLGETVMDVGLGAAVGRNTGWSTESAAQISEEAHALAWSMSQSHPGGVVPQWPDGAGCDALGRTQMQIRAVAQHGAMGAAREYFRTSGRSIAEVKQAYRQQLAVWQAAAKLKP
jgi:hypothetical protein